jgi:hypothetical protein
MKLHEARSGAGFRRRAGRFGLSDARAAVKALEGAWHVQVVFGAHLVVPDRILGWMRA